MDRNQFRQEFDDYDNVELSDIKNNRRMDKLTRIALSHDTLVHDEYGQGLTSVVITMEELAELQKELSKVIRNKQDFYGILEEMADTIIMLYRMKIYLGIKNEELIRAINIKLDQFQKKMEQEEEEMKENGTES